MKIVSNFKDYYDYLAGKYGIDEKCVYERVCQSRAPGGWAKTGLYKPEFELASKQYKAFTIDFCDTRYYGYYYLGVIYYGRDAGIIPYDYIWRDFPKKEEDKLNWSKRREIKESGAIFDPIKVDYNTKETCPVLLDYDQHGFGTKNVKLLDFGFQKVVPPEDAFLKISEFLMKEPVIINRQTDKEKIEAHGMSVKTSFRNMPRKYLIRFGKGQVKYFKEFSNPLYNHKYPYQFSGRRTRCKQFKTQEEAQSYCDMLSFTHEQYMGKLTVEPFDNEYSAAESSFARKLHSITKQYKFLQDKHIRSGNHLKKHLAFVNKLLHEGRITREEILENIGKMERRTPDEKI